jgi:diguanylate cyclase (GGDEF)-like protein
VPKPDAAVKGLSPAPAPARTGRAAARKVTDPLKIFTWWVATPAVLVYICICVLVLMTLYLMTSEINRIDADRGVKAVQGALGAFGRQLGEQVADEATWTEAYINTYIEFNPAWLDATWGTTARDDGHYDTAVISDARGNILFGESSRGPIAGAIGSVYFSADAMIEALGETIAEAGDDSIVAGLTQSPSGVAAVAAAVVHGASGQMIVPADERRILWLGKSIDAALLNELSHRFQIPVIHFDSDGAAGPGDQSLALTDVVGKTIATLVWRPLRPGDAAFLHTASLASIALLVVGLLIFAVLTAFRRSVERRAESDERDWMRARYDPTTGLINRIGLEESIRSLTPRTGELNVAIACIEFEGLRDISASYGQETSEALLDRVADLIDASLDEGIHIARLGPDEFALCGTGGAAGPLIRRCARIVSELVSEAIALDDLRLKLTASIGIAEAHVTRKTLSAPIDMAVAAGHHARETGGSHIVEHSPSIEENRQKRLALQTDIRRGLEAGEFDLVYQPIFDFGSQQMLGVEALMRWPRRAGGAMSPAEFIPAAESSGLIEDLGMFALRRACRDLAPYTNLKLSVNVSTVQFRSPTLASKIDEILSAAAFPPERLQLEITESFLLAQPDRAKRAIEDLRTRGITIALDDFGTGFSSIGYLQQFSFDRVKLDRSLVEDIDVDPVKAALVESTMVFAFAMGLAVTAEGVERREEAGTLTRLGCREFQGYLFSRPLTLEGLSRLVQPGDGLRRAG